MIVQRFPSVIVLILVSLLFTSATPAQIRTIAGVTAAQNENSLTEATKKIAGIGFYLIPGLS